MKITKEYLDEQFSKLATKQDVDELARIAKAGFDEVCRRLETFAIKSSA
jgi:hypothetical protein